MYIHKQACAHVCAHTHTHTHTIYKTIGLPSVSTSWHGCIEKAYFVNKKIMQISLFTHTRAHTHTHTHTHTLCIHKV